MSISRAATSPATPLWRHGKVIAAREKFAGRSGRLREGPGAGAIPPGPGGSPPGNPNNSGTRDVWPGYSYGVNRLGELERAIMDILWESPEPLTVRQVSGNLTERDLAHTTVMTVLDRLAKKGFARRERDGRAWRYRAAETREAYVTELMLSALEQTGDRHAALARFARSVSETEAAALRRALEALGQGSTARPVGEDRARGIGE